MLHRRLHVNPIMSIKMSGGRLVSVKGEYAFLLQLFNDMAGGFYVELGKKRSDPNNWIRALF